MNNLILDEINMEKFGPYTLVTGILLVLLGITGIFIPSIVSIGTLFFVSWLLLIGGVFWTIHTYRYDPKNVMSWLKPILLFCVGGLMLFYPMTGIATVGLLLSVYLFIDSISNFALAQTVHPAKGWGWMVLNGFTSALLATLFLIGWPMTSLWLVGLYVSISLLFDGWALLAIGWMLRKDKKSEVNLHNELSSN